MQVIHAGYKDPDNLKFDTITVLGVPYPPLSVSVTHIGATDTGESAVPNTNIRYDADKKVHTHFFFKNYSTHCCGNTSTTA